MGWPELNGFGVPDPDCGYCHVLECTGMFVFCADLVDIYRFWIRKSKYIQFVSVVWTGCPCHVLKCTEMSLFCPDLVDIYRFRIRLSKNVQFVSVVWTVCPCYVLESTEMV